MRLAFIVAATFVFAAVFAQTPAQRARKAVLTPRVALAPLRRPQTGSVQPMSLAPYGVPLQQPAAVTGPGKQPILPGF